MSLPRLHDYLHPDPDDLDLYQCREVTCGGLFRLPNSGSFCSGTPERKHASKVMRVIPDDGQQETPGLLIDDAGWGWV